MANKLAHARHNCEACDLLHTDGKFSDWVVTTAFYAALHYVDVELFPNPYEIGGKIESYRSFDEYYQDYRSVRGRASKHNVRRNLVTQELPDVADDYNTLEENCSTARYTDYRVDPAIATLCRDALVSIKTLCEPVIG